MLFCKQNPLETLPELPLGLTYLMCEMPIHGEHIDLDTTPEEIQLINARIQSWTDMMRRESKMRCMKRCAQYKEQIMMKAWHPSRVERMLEMGYEMEDM